MSEKLKIINLKKTDNNSMSEKLSHNFVNVRAAKVNVLLYTFFAG